jgi:preprotein translocase subunit SecG
MLYYFVVTLYVLVCLLLMVTILLQQGKGGDIANAFGGGSSQAVFGARSGATLLTRATSVLAALFVILAMVLTVWGQRGPGSVVGGLGAPPAPAAAPAPANASPTTTPAPAATTPAPAPATPPKTP